MNEPEIIYEDADILVINKPSGLAVHGDGRSTAPTLVDWLLARFPELAKVGESMTLPDGNIVARPGIVHRLDRDTSGAMVVARTPRAYSNLKKQFARREVQKNYRAFVYGALKEERGVIDRPVGRSSGSGSQRSIKDPHGRLREARTIFHTRLSAAEASYLDVFPKTGRTHQIRVHLSSIGHAVVADPLYAKGKPAVLGFSRMALHAFSLTFKHPVKGRGVSFEAPLPKEFLTAEEELRRH